MSDYKLIPIHDQNRWIDALKSCVKYDTYHLPEYHLLAEKQKEGSPSLFLFQDGEGFAAFPFLLRRISDVQGLENSQAYDVTSVYGYSGVVTNVENGSVHSATFRETFQRTLLQILRDKQVIAFFTRQNPLIRTSWLFQGMGVVHAVGKTVAIDLTQSLREQERGMTKGHRYDIRKARVANILAYEDKEYRRISDFVSVYNETMKRNNALEYYMFPRSYYADLTRLLRGKIKLFVAEKDGVLVGASLFLVTGKILQYHLSGTPDRWASYSGAKVILDEVRRWGTAQGYEWLHLGGGLSSMEDSLFRFKAGFSKLRFSFEIVKAILEPQMYDCLIAQRNGWLESNGYERASVNYFPVYRAPMMKKESVVNRLAI